MPGPPRKREPPILNLPRGNEALRDLEDPTHAFPIGGKRKKVDSEDDLLMLDPPIRIDDEDEGDFPEPTTPKRPAIDARLVALWLVVASLLAVLLGIGLALAVVYR